MTLPTFLDTGAIYALADRNDLDHPTVKAVYAEKDRRFITHEYVLVEAFSLLTKRLHKDAAIRTVAALRRSSRIEIVAAGQHLLNAGWERAVRFGDKEWDWIDCMSFIVMEEHRLREALSLDHHFSQAGFVVLV